MTRKEERRKMANKGFGPPGKPGVKIVSHCPECPPYPREGSGMVSIAPGQKKASCRKGHTWAIHPGFRQGRRSIAI